MSKAFLDVHDLIAATAQHYQYPPPPKMLLNLQELVSTLLRMLLDLIASLLSVIPGNTDTRTVGNFMRLGLYFIGLLGAVLLVWLLFSRLSELSKQAHLARTSTLPDSAPLTAAAWHRQALHFAQMGNWKDACRALLLAAVRLLDEQKVVPFIANRTNFEYGYALVSRASIRSNFRSLADTVDVCWFGNNEAEEADFRNCQTYFEAIRSELAAQANTDRNRDPAAYG
ncbi:MAG: hypothetical protein C5B53_10395 [Candidatus Melainabacteria bacterium]|nr:MAG: hypothetical protein C5B53_10395 [Candidatus Melainabacteria bacterium]